MMQLPVTRYYGSKRKVVERIWDVLASRAINYNSVLDIFGGTGIVSYLMAAKGKEVIYNDVMQFNCMIARALLQSPRGNLDAEQMLGLLQEDPNIVYKHYIEDIYNFISIPVLSIQQSNFDPSSESRNGAVNAEGLPFNLLLACRKEDQTADHQSV